MKQSTRDSILNHKVVYPPELFDQAFIDAACEMNGGAKFVCESEVGGKPIAVFYKDPPTPETKNVYYFGLHPDMSIETHS